MLPWLLLGSLFCCGCLVNAAYTIIESCHQCIDVSRQKANVTVTPKTFSYPQIVDIDVITSIPLGNQLRLSLELNLKAKPGTQQWMHLTTIEDDFCRVLRFYVGPFAHDIETAMAIPRGICPIEKGNYHARNHSFDFNKFKLQALPFGKYRTIFKFLEKSTGDVVSCTVLLISHTN